jgi:hypothetical protein
MPGSSVITAGPRRHRDRIAVVGGGIGGQARPPLHGRDAGRRRGHAAFAGEDPLSHNDWLYGYDAERAAAAATPGG